MKDQFLGMNIKQNTTNEYRYFFESNFVGVNKLFVLLYTNEDEYARRFKSRGYYITKMILLILLTY